MIGCPLKTTYFVVGLLTRLQGRVWLGVMCRIILINSVIVVVSQRCAAQFFRLFGLQRFEKFGRKEITDGSTSKNVQFFKW